MSDLRRRIDRRLRDAATGRFAREIGASVLATVIGGAVISYAAREVAPPVAPMSKSSERLASSAPPDRSAMVQEMSGPLQRASIPVPVATPTAVQASAPAIPVRAAARPLETAPRRLATVAVIPPVRPAERVTVAEADVPAAAREPVRVFGWSVPGSDLLPTGAEAARTVSELGRQVGKQVGRQVASIGEQVGLR